MNENILVVENEMQSLNAAFELANFRKYRNSLNVESVPKSQDVRFDELRNDYALVFVDITLANNTEMNGYGVIRKILENDYFPIDRIVVMTGNSEIKDGLRQNGIPEDIAVLMKPFSFLDLEKVLANYIAPTGQAG